MNTFKKILLTLCVVLAAGGMMQAKPIAFGVKAGLNVNKIKFDKDFANSDNSCGWTAGVMADFTIPIIGLGADVSLMYARMNNSSSVTYEPTLMPTPGQIGSDAATASTNNGENLYGKNFLEIPINIKYKFTLPVVGNYLAPYIFTGPNFAFRLDKSATFNDLKSRSCQVAWNVGLGVQLMSHVQIGASYAFGINNVVKNITDVVNPVDIKAKNNYWTVTAAYLF